MNFKKLMLIVVPLVVLIVGYQWMTRVDRSDAVEVATAFTKNLRSDDVDAAGKYYLPEKLETWQDTMRGMKSGARERFIERIPAYPAFTPPVTDAKGVTTVSSADKAYWLEMQQIDGKWYVTRHAGGT